MRKKTSINFSSRKGNSFRKFPQTFHRAKREFSKVNKKMQL